MSKNTEELGFKNKLTEPEIRMFDTAWGVILIHLPPDSHSALKSVLYSMLNAAFAAGRLAGGREMASVYDRNLGATRETRQRS